jgi:pyruvate-formate lyase-activating enzyme
MKPPALIVADENGRIMDIPELSMAVGGIRGAVMPGEESLIPLPSSSLLFTLPGRTAIGFDESSGKIVEVPELGGKRVYAAAAFMPPGYVCTGHAAYGEEAGAPRLPLYCYAAAGWRNGKFHAAGHRVDRRLRHEIPDGSLRAIDAKARIFRGKHKGNRLVSHLVNNCVLAYRCPNAINLVLGRWECPVPVSRACNASCVGCISHQPKASRVQSTQHRLDFTPSVDEILDYVVPHLKTAPNPIASFGQGCEGEPLLEAELVEEAIRKIREKTRRGIINLNTNGSLPRAVERLCRAGLGSMRVSMNSAQTGFYRAYYRPRGYSFCDVAESIGVAKRSSVWVSLNYLVFPGLTDHPSEIEALERLIRRYGIDMIQTRNLNIEPEWYAGALGLDGLEGPGGGIVSWLNRVRRKFPRVRIGYFNPVPPEVRARVS